jgi:CheY-like chemotaxis protein
MREMAGFLATVLICEFVEADDGEESLELARSVRPDVIILDLMMPRLNGLEVLKAMRQEEALAHTRVIVLTAQPATREEALRAGADVVMVKPFEPEQIAAAVEEVLTNRA